MSPASARSFFRFPISEAVGLKFYCGTAERMATVRRRGGITSHSISSKKGLEGLRMNKNTKKHANVVKLRLGGFPLDALDQKRMRRLRKMSDETRVPIQDLVNDTIDKLIKATVAEAELPTKIVKFPTPYTMVCSSRQRSRL
jgi:hypothetical protein